eukprot:TRINITY_DN5377_c0_g1_i2.p2 TRINITY_DN5377_c0_g1~~TRINITY_DN5377_c0_g1_i2.p2  ORF type:complete len:331 (+),score=89.88 TRINITY_DN5377_c0_g1_i2:100-993(+)
MGCGRRAAVLALLPLLAAGAEVSTEKGLVGTDQCTALRGITALTFEDGGAATRVRTPSVPALQCTGSCFTGVLVEAAQCVAQGVDDSGRPQWKCQGRMTPGYRFARVKVQCEGCSAPGDPLVRKGSCALRYSLARTGPLRGRGAQRGLLPGRSLSDAHSPDSGYSTGGTLLFLLAAGVLCCLCARSRHGSGNPPVAYAYGRPDIPTGIPVAGGGMGGGFGSGWGSTLGGLGTGLFLGSMMERGWGGHQQPAQPYAGGADYGDYAHGGGYADGGGHSGDFGGGYDQGGGDAFGGTDVV